MSSVPHGLAGTSPSGAATTLTTVDTTHVAPLINTTARDAQPAASVVGTPLILTGDASTARIRTLAGFFKFIADSIYFPWGQRLSSAAVRAAGIGQPAWFLQSLLTYLGSLRPLFSPGLFASLQQAGAVVGRFVQGYFMGPGTITAVGSILQHLNPGTYLTPDALLTLAGSIASRFIPLVHLAAQIAASGVVVGRFVQGFFLTPNAVVTAAAQIVGLRVPALAALLSLHGAVATFYQRGRQFFVTLHLSSALRRAASRASAGQVHAAAVLLRETGKALAAQPGVAAVLQAGYGFFGTFSALLEPATFFEALRTRFLSATEQASGALGPAQITAVRSALLSLSGALRRAIVGAGYSASVPLVALLQAGRAFTATLTSSSVLSGAVATARTLLRLLSATLQATAALGPAQVGKRLVASLTLSSATLRAIDVARAATLAATSALAKVLVLARAAFASTLTAAGSVVGTLVRSLAATLEVSAALGPTQIDTLRAATLTLSSATTRAIDVARTATLTATAALAKVLELARTAFSAMLTAAGSLFAALSKVFAAALDASAALGPAVVGKILSATLALTAALVRAIVVARAAALNVSALLRIGVDPVIDSTTLEILYDTATGEELFAIEITA